MSDPARGSYVRTLMRSGTSIAIAIGVMNLATYGFTIVAARILGPTEYGALAGLMATLMVLAVLQLGLQATAARRISAEPEHVAQIEQSIMRVTYRGALVLGAVLVKRDHLFTGMTEHPFAIAFRYKNNYVYLIGLAMIRWAAVRA